MEKPFYLIPDGSLSPVSSGDGYRDYLLSDLICGSSFELLSLRLSPDSLLMPFYPLSNILLTMRFSVPGTKRHHRCVVCPLCLCRKFTYGILSAGSYDDVRLRYVYDGDEIVNILWVSVYKDGEVVFSLE